MTEKQIEASRRNGARSHGPKTAAGKARSARNAIRHGLLAEINVLDNESEPRFRRYFKAMIEKFQPADEIELGVVEEMAIASWKTRRAWAIENNAFNTRMKTSNLGSELDRLSAAFTDLAKPGSEFHLLQRYEARHNRAFWRNLRGLARMREQKLPNEPES